MVHDDDDIGVDENHENDGMLQPCVQLEKTGCSLGEYNFGNLESIKPSHWLFGERCTLLSCIQLLTVFRLFNGHHNLHA
jgi:hypothetical protein